MFNLVCSALVWLERCKIPINELLLTLKLNGMEKFSQMKPVNDSPLRDNSSDNYTSIIELNMFSCA